MKALFRILFITTILTFIFYTYSQSVSKTNDKPAEDATLEELQEYASEALSRPTTGVSTYIGKASKDIIEKFGEPARKELSAYEYEWWVYTNVPENFMMVAILDDSVQQIYVSGKEVKTDPVVVGSTLDDIYRTSIIEPEIILNVGEQLYTLTLNDYDLKHRLLIKFDEIVAQVFVNNDEVVTGVRFFSHDAIVALHPYDVAYAELHLRPQTVTSEMNDVMAALENQVLDIAFVQRYYKELPRLVKDDRLMSFASLTSEHYVQQQQLGKKEITSLKERIALMRLEAISIKETFEVINFDAIELVHRWLNEDEGEGVLLSTEDKQVGVACEANVCTYVVGKLAPIAIERRQLE